MHNKSFTADNQVTIVGGRNIGDEYFDVPAAGILFEDLDVIGAGPVAADVSSDFDRYWASESSYPIDRLVRRTDPERLAKIVDAERDPDAASYLKSIRDSEFARRFADRTLPLEWAPVRMVSDDPAKVLRRHRDDSLVLDQLMRIFGEPKSKIDLVSPYFVPGVMGTDLFRRWSEKGVKIRILTNALEATDVAAVHAGYAKRRKALLAAGVTLYELRRTSQTPAASHLTGSSSSSLHAKTFSVDGSRVFIGSFNFDPRSARLNTEMGFVIESPSLAARIDEAFDTVIPRRSYLVQLTPGGDLTWTNGATRLDREPGTTRMRSFIVWLASRLPIEWML
jgi:putative cardiolipin synthase